MEVTLCRCIQYILLLTTTLYTIRGDDLCINSDRPGQLELSCPQPNGVIVEVDILAGKGHCRAKEAQCYGESANLLVDVHRCYWSSNCTVKFPTDPIIRVPSTPLDSESCFGEVPDFMKSDALQCFEPTLKGAPTTLIDICNPGDKAGFSNISGLIRSHVHYPWLYEPDMKSCVIELYRTREKQLLVTVLDLELDEDDSLRLTSIDLGRNVKENITLTSTSSLRVPDPQVTIDFTIGSYSNGGRGFLVCFTYVDESDRIDDACEHVLGKGEARTTSMLAEEPPKKVCKNKRGKERPCKKKKGNRKKKKGDGKKGKKKDRKNRKKNKERKKRSK